MTWIHARHYTQDDVRALISYAADRGVRVVPEFDIPGHSRGFLPIEGQVHFCEKAATRSQLYADPANQTFTTVHSLLEEMAALFSDEVRRACHKRPVTPRLYRPCSAPCSARPR